MSKLKIAANIMIIHGTVEIAGFAAALFANHMTGISIFALDFFAKNLLLIGIMGAIFGILRIFAAAKILRNEMSGFALGIVMCVITLTLMIFMIPSGIIDGIFAGAALILLLDVYFMKKKIVEEKK